MTTATPTVHTYFLLDRSGSMQAIADDVVGGFNAFLASQQADGDDMRMTLVQFDSHDPHEVIADAVPIAEIAPLTSADFEPRGGTPLYDAMGQVIADATIRAEQRAGAGEAPEEIVFVTFTDGMENQSHEYDRDQIFTLVEKREKKGWTSVYLGANQDAYAEGGHFGMRATSTQNWTADGDGVHLAYASVDRAMLAKRGDVRALRIHDRTDFFRGVKEAEEKK